MEITRHAWHHLLSERLVIIIVVKQVIQVECKVNIVVQQIRHTEIGYPIRIEPRVVRCITVYFTGITATQVKFQILQDLFSLSQLFSLSPSYPRRHMAF